jgi:type I restriction enzyme R subunit
MSNILNEKTFEDAIISSLCENGGYVLGDAKSFDKDLAFDKETILKFLYDTQKESWEKLEKYHGDEIRNKLTARIYKELDLRGMLDVLRNGIVDYGVRFNICYFKPENSKNPDLIELYDKNILTVTRQVYYSLKNSNSLDLLLSINGMPVATMELKNHFTGQNVKNAKKQYMLDRSPKELLFSSKKRALVHFAVDSDEVYLTTKLDGNKTRFLPFNMGFNEGAGNPPNHNGYKTAYLWENILKKDSWLEIIGRFIHRQKNEVELKNKTIKTENLIFPRYHQLDVVRKLIADVKQKGAGQNYLIQHSAGSGKSNSIAWCAYRLSSLHDNSGNIIFNSVIVITDRKVLDRQLQDTIYQFEHKRGVVDRIDKDSTQLAEAIKKGTPIIITTLQKFPFILDKVGDLPDRRYAVIIDEAHSSQGGEASKKMNEVLSVSKKSEAEKLEEAQMKDDGYYDEIEDEVENSLKARGRQENVSFFAFTATPKPKTLEVFGTKKDDGRYGEFHLYSMRQAIEEGFILDVLKNYTTYELSFKLSKAIEEDPKLNKKEATKAISRFVSLHPYNIAQKSEVMIEHFRQVTSKKIGGLAKAMVVTASRLHALRYFNAFKKYIKEKNYNDIRALVAFSGKVIDDIYPDGVSEAELNGFGEKELPAKFESDEYQILLVAEKYQTGFDQPLLHTMYVDRKLSGVKAVQTLSRLNRIHAGKDDTFILDFANDRETIFKSFAPYYKTTRLEEETNPNHLYDLKARLDEFSIYWQSEIEQFTQIYFKSKKQLTFREQEKLYAVIQPSVDRYKGLEEDKQDEFKKGLRTWCNIYSYLSQIVPFGDAEFEKFYAFAKLLLTKLPKRNMSERLQLDDEVALEYYRLQKIEDGEIKLDQDDEFTIKGVTEAGLKKDKDDEVSLSEIINILNEKFDTDFTDADRLFFEQIEAELMKDETLQAQAKNNSIDNFKYGFEEIFINKLIDRMEDNQDIFNKILDDDSFGDVVKKWMMKKVYKNVNEVK